MSRGEIRVACARHTAQHSGSSSQRWWLSMRLSRGDGMTFRQWRQTHKHINPQSACFLHGGAPLILTKKHKKQNKNLSGHSLCRHEHCTVGDGGGQGGALIHIVETFLKGVVLSK